MSFAEDFPLDEGEMDQLPDSVRKIFDRAKEELQRGQGELQSRQEKLGKEQAQLVLDRETFEKMQKEFLLQQKIFKKQQEAFAAKERAFDIQQEQLHVDRQAVIRDRVTNTVLATQLKNGQVELERNRQTLRNKEVLHVTATTKLHQDRRQFDSVREAFERKAFELNTQERTQKDTVSGVSSLFIVGGYLLFVGLLVFHCYGYFTSSSGGSSGDSFIDSLYMTVVTTFTVGYGDIVPHSFGTKMLCDGLVLAGHWVPIILFSWLRSIAHRLDQRFLSTIERQSLRRFYHLCAAICAILVSIFLGVVGFYIFESDRILGASHGSPPPPPTPPPPPPPPPSSCLCPSPSPSPSPSLLRFSDVFHMSVMTVTTAGYGDITFVTPGGRAFATIWIPISVTLFACGMTFLTEFLLDCCRRRHRDHRRSVIAL